MVKKKKSRLFQVLMIILSLVIVSNLLVMVFYGSGKTLLSGNVLVIPITGSIMVGSDSGLLSDSVTSSTKVIEQLDLAETSDQIRAVVLEVNSGGGSAVASNEIVTRINNFDKPIVSVIREVGASGAYWSASSSDYIFADPLSMVGSIGVISSYLDFSEFLDDKNISYERLVSGKYKDAGIPFRELTSEERSMKQEQLDKVKEYFVNSVSENRNISLDKLEPLSQGQVFLGMDSIELGLIDELGGMSDAKLYLENNLNTTIYFDYIEEELSFMDIMGLKFDNLFYMVGQGIGSKLNPTKSNFKI